MTAGGCAQPVCVIIAAFAAAPTIGRAVASALAQPEVAEVIVVDDASPDLTVAAAWGADDGTGRLSVHVMERNGGPSAARNLALARGHAPLVAVLDADDFLLPGRFAALLAMGDLDLAADNIVFVTPARADTLDPDKLPAFPAKLREVDLATFVAGNLARKGVQRGELGFLKPLMSRSFLDRHGLRYDEAMRLGEDYDLYVRMLLEGARFGLTDRLGYGAVVRPGSLSGQHRTEDLRQLMQASARHLAAVGRDAEARRWIARHHRATRAKYLLRAFLDSKEEGGLISALGFAVAPPSRFVPIATGVLRDKLAAQRPAAPVPPERYLLSPDQPAGE